MNLQRGRRETRYSSGEVEIFDPFFRWVLMDGLYQFGIRGNFDIGFMWGYTVGGVEQI